jgi:hypothetical protein
MNLEVHAVLQYTDFFLPLDITHSGLLAHVDLFIIFQETSILFSLMAIIIYIGSLVSFSFLHFYQYLLVVWGEGTFTYVLTIYLN